MALNKIKLNKKKFYFELSEKVINILNKKKNVVNIFFTGGNSAKKLYENIANNSNKINLQSKVKIFQTDKKSNFIKKKFGVKVFNIVKQCSDYDELNNQNDQWLEKKKNIWKPFRKNLNLLFL